jgi:penicillin amidase/acyl-homoserine-lactone acylase
VPPKPPFLRRRWVRALLVVALLVGAWRVVRPRLRPAPPAPDAVTLQHAANVRILRDRWGVPHIHGRSDADAAFGLAYANAEDDWPTIQSVLAAARGQLGLLFLSKTALANDYYVGLVGVAEQVAEQYPRLAPDVRAVLEAYARGLNLYAHQHPDEVDGRLLPITGRDVAAGFAHKLPLLMGFTSVLGGLNERPPAGAGDVAPRALPGGGSNAHAVHRARSTDDVTRLNVNSHQPWEGPVSWYEAQVRSDEGWNMTGGLFPGAPVILHGHNDHLGWAHTVNTPDLIDVYALTVRAAGGGALEYRLGDRWLPLEERDVPLAIDTGFFTWTAHKKAYRSAHGPVMETDRGFFAVRYAGMDRLLFAAEQWFRMNKARDLDGWKAAMAIGGVPSFNTVYADRDHVLYVYNARLPVRREGPDYTRVLPGDDEGLIWRDSVPFAALPRVEDPRSGFVQSCNHTPFAATAGDENPRPASFSTTAGIETHMTNRALRTEALLAGEARLSRDDFLALKWDRGYAPEAAIFRELVAPLLAGFAPASDDERRALELLRGWDGRADEASPAAALAIAAWRHMAADGQVAAKEKTADPAVALRRAIRLLRQGFGRVEVPLGELQRLRRGAVDLPLGGGPDLLNAVYTRQRGGRLVGYQGDSYVLVVEFGPDGVTSSSVSQYGSSQRPGSPHHADQAALFARRELKPTLRREAELRAALEREYRPDGGR